VQKKDGSKGQQGWFLLNVTCHGDQAYVGLIEHTSTILERRVIVLARPLVMTKPCTAQAACNRAVNEARRREVYLSEMVRIQSK